MERQLPQGLKTPLGTAGLIYFAIEALATPEMAMASASLGRPRASPFSFLLAGWPSSSAALILRPLHGTTVINRLLVESQLQGHCYHMGSWCGGKATSIYPCSILAVLLVGGDDNAIAAKARNACGNPAIG